MKSAPYHPASNGLAERAVQTFKAYMKKSTTGTINARVSCFLSQYRITPHSTTGISPAEMLLGRRPRTRLDLLRPDINSRVQLRQQSQKWHHDQKARERKFQVGDSVSVRNFTTGDTWLPGTIVESRGPLSFQVKLQDGRTVRRHLDHIIYRPASQTLNGSDWMDLPQVTESSSILKQPPVAETAPPPLRRSSRISVPPRRYGQDGNNST